MAISLQSDGLVRSARANQEITWTVRLKNAGSVTDSVTVRVFPTNENYLTNRILYGSLFSDHTRFALAYQLAPQESVTFTVYGWFRNTANQWLEPPTLRLEASNYYDVSTREMLTATLEMYQEENGLVVPEAEEAAWGIGHSEPGWLTGTVISGYTGAGYVQAWPDVDRIYSTTAITAAPSLEYPINFTTPGTYTIWLRGYAPNAAGDSVYVSLDDQPPTILTGLPPRQWAWQKTNLTYEVTEPSERTLFLWQREDGLKTDRILLTTDPGYNPQGNGPNESLRIADD